MQTITPALSAHLAQEVTSIATCWSIKRKDGKTLYFTDHDRDVVVGGNRYVAADSMNPSAVSSQSGLTVDNLEFEGLLSAGAVDEEDLRAGRYDHAEIHVFLVNYNAPEMGALTLKHGWLGEVTVKGGQFVAEMRGLTSRLQQHIGDVYTSACRAAFGDARCGIALSNYRFGGSVTGVEALFAFSDSTKLQVNDYFAGGIVEFTSGANTGIRMEVRDFSVGRFGLFYRCRIV